MAFILKAAPQIESKFTVLVNKVSAAALRKIKEGDNAAIIRGEITGALARGAIQEGSSVEVDNFVMYYNALDANLHDETDVVPELTPKFQELMDFIFTEAP